MDKQNEINTITQQKMGQLKAILYLLQTNLDEIKDEVDRSYELLKIGEMTNLVKEIEGSISNPLDSLLNVSNKIDTQIAPIIDIFVRSFFHKNRHIVAAAYKTKAQLNPLHYFIVLKDDNIDNRNSIFGFFDKYDLLEISNKCPVSFQFIPKELASEISFSEAIKLN